MSDMKTIVEDEVWCDHHGTVHATTTDPYEDDDQCSEEVWEALLRVPLGYEPTQTWINAMLCVRPTEEFAAKVGRSVIRNAMESEHRDGLGVARLALVRVAAS